MRWLVIILHEVKVVEETEASPWLVMGLVRTSMAETVTFN